MKTYIYIHTAIRNYIQGLINVNAVRTLVDVRDCVGYSFWSYGRGSALADGMNGQ